MKRTLSPREAADLLGITVETLRRWESEGAVRAVRTLGGQRRYSAREVRALRSAGTRRNHAVSGRPSLGTEESAAPEQPSNAPPPPAPSPTLPPWERRVREEQADLAITRLRSERAALVRAERDAASARAEREAAERASAEAEARAAQEHSEAEDRERQRLAALRDFGNALARFAPPEYQIRVVQDLQRFVTTDELPVAMGDFLAREHVRARVDRILNAWREREAAVTAQREADQRRRSLIDSGRLRASVETFSWESREAQRAIRDVERALSAEVESDWTLEDVRDLVDDVLAEWDQ